MDIIVANVLMAQNAFSLGGIVKWWRLIDQLVLFHRAPSIQYLNFIWNV